MKKILLLTISAVLLFAGIQYAAAFTSYVDSVESFTQGLKKNGDPITDPARTDPAEALGVEDGVFVSLGYGGELIVKFPVIVGGTLAITTFEATWGSYPLEEADVYVSKDGVDYDFIGTANNLTGQPSREPHPWTIDLEGKCVRYVKLVDVTDSNLHGLTSDGFDIDAIKADYTEACPVEPLVCPEGTSRQLLETVAVPSNGSTVLSTNVLENGVTYILKASGTYTYWPAQLPEAGIADAEYSLRPEGNNNPGPGPQWISGDDLDSPWENYLEVKVDGNPVDWGLFNTDHVYEIVLVGTGSQVDFRILDSYYPDNSGELQVEIYKCVCEPVCCSGDIEVTNDNHAKISNDVEVEADTGNNDADGGSGNDGGDSGSTTAIAGSNATGGDGGWGGGNAQIRTGHAYSTATLFNAVNTNITRIRR